jgi:hypothetical protein
MLNKESGARECERLAQSAGEGRDRQARQAERAGHRHDGQTGTTETAER